MNNGNSSKQVLLSILGIAVLVIAVVGVSFAFFTYSYTGDDQRLKSGEIFFQFTEGDHIALTNQFPMSDAEGEALSTGSNQVITFTITGKNAGDFDIPFEIRLVAGTPIDEKTQFEDGDIKVKLTENSDTHSLYNNLFVAANNVNYEGGNTADEGGALLAKGKIGPSDTTCTYELRMWIDENVTFGTSDVEGESVKYDDISDMYYSVKVLINAGDAVVAEEP